VMKECPPFHPFRYSNIAMCRPRFPSVDIKRQWCSKFVGIVICRWYIRSDRFGVHALSFMLLLSFVVMMARHVTCGRRVI
jgi:hypothetical protein